MLKQGGCTSPTLFKIYLKESWKMETRSKTLFTDWNYHWKVIAEDLCDLEEANMRKTEYMMWKGKQRDIDLENDITVKQ